jgi:hypothetical protein
MQQDHGPSMRWIAGLAVLCLALLAWIYLGFVLPFRAAAAGRELLAARLQGFDTTDVLDMLQFLHSHPDAAAIQQGLTFGPALIFPAVLVILLLLLLKRARPGGAFFGRAIPSAVIAALFFLPIFYGLAAYGETILSMLIFSPAAPSDQTVAWVSGALPLLARLKLVALAVTVILLIRFAALSGRSEEP